MFFVGDLSLAVESYQQRARNESPVVPDDPIDEMPLEDLRWALVVARIAYDLAIAEGASQALLELLEKPYEDLFRRVCRLDPVYRIRSIRVTANTRPKRFLEIAKSES